MMNSKGMALSVCGLAALSLAAAARPDYGTMKQHLRKDHPRLFITRGQIPAFRARANGVCRKYLEEIRAIVDALPDEPKLEFKDDVVSFDGEKVVFKRNINDQNAVIYGIKNAGGVDAARCAILFYATGDRKYVAKGYKYMMLNLAFAELSMRSRILPEWYDTSRLAALVAYDWLCNELTPEQRRAFIVPMLKHLDFMRDPGYPRNSGGAESGNYGERGLWWYAGLAAYGDKLDDAAAEKFLRDGWKLSCDMMDWRDRIAADTGLLVSICTAYSFGWYPYATNHFLLTLRSACAIDGTRFWTQPRDYADYFNWMMIPAPGVYTGFHDFGWGDTSHMRTVLEPNFMYTHLAHIIHLYGRSETASALMTLLPEKYRDIALRNDFPWTPFILTGFDPEQPYRGDAAAALNTRTARFFPAFGLLNMRSGIAPDDTYASIKAGARQSGHQHFDELSFVIYKKGFQALDTGVRGSVPHHLGYYPQTVAHNSLLIRMEGEPLPRIWYPANAPRVDWDKVCCDGGQNRMTAGRNLGFDQSKYHASTAGDATACYAAEKCREAVRQFVYIKPDYFVVYDRLTSVKPDQQKVFLLHTQGEPKAMGEGVWRSTGGEGALFLRTVLPEEARTDVIGGPGREFWSNGRNYPLDASEPLMNHLRRIGTLADTWLGCWRLEISPARADTKARFLTVMQAADGSEPAMVPVKRIAERDADGVSFTTKEGIAVTVMFRREGLIAGRIRLERNGKVLLDKPLHEPARVMPPPPAERK